MHPLKSRYRANTMMQENCISFKGINTGKINNLSFIKSMSKCKMDNIYDTLSSKIAPDFVTTTKGGNCLYKKGNSFIDTLKYPFLDLPRDILNAFADKFNIEGLKKSDLLTNYNNQKQQKAYERAMRGLLQNSDNFLEEICKKRNVSLEDVKKLSCQKGCNAEFSEICTEVTKEFHKLYDENFSKTKAQYHTPHERTVVRLVTGIVAAIMLGNDFYNKTILNGKDDKTANEELKIKRKQEIIATAQEALSQYFMLGALSGFTNNSKWGAPILNTALGILFHITSRLSTNRSLVKIKPQSTIHLKTPKLEEYAKNPQARKQEFEIKNPKEEDKNKKHILTFKNIGLACLASIGLGFLGKGVKSTKAFNSLKNYLMNTKQMTFLNEKFHNFTVGEVWVSLKEKDEFISALIDNPKYSKSINEQIAKSFDNPDLVKQFKNANGTYTDKILLGEYEKMSKIPLVNWEVSRKELLQIPLAPFKLAVELFSYPYKAAHKILEGLHVVKKVDKSKLKNDYHVLNTYIDYKEQLQKHKDLTPEQFRDFYTKRVNNNIISALNKETKSSVDNAAIGKTTQLLGTFGSLYFAMTDDYNRTIAQTNDIDKANKDARLRGVNKMVRIATQSVCMGINQLFKIPYAKSILGAASISTACTIMTDKISRFLSGMPSKRMSKEELEKYNQSKKQGALKRYYNAIDRITE